MLTQCSFPTNPISLSPHSLFHKLYLSFTHTHYDGALKDMLSKKLYLDHAVYNVSRADVVR
jgi:hypothetical protein